jgi:hypothetical protein
MLRASSCLLFSVFAAAPLAAQAGGFTSGDLYLYDPDVTGTTLLDGALVHIDPLSGQSDIALDTFLTPSLQGALAFDPYRQRLVLFGSAGNPLDPAQLWCVDAAGNLDATGATSDLYGALAPTGDGRIYMRNYGSHSDTDPFQWLDAANQFSTLMDETGTAPFLLEGDAALDVHGMIYDAGTNALFVASDSGGACAGGQTNKANIHKLPLSADGTRVEGPVSCAQIEVSTSGETPAGWSRGPAGQLLLLIDTNSNAKEARLQLVDPVTLTSTAFASPGSYIGAAALNAGSWSTALGKAVVLDTLNDQLHAFGPGETGTGSVLPDTGPLSSADISGEADSLIEIAPNACPGGWLPFGQGLAGTGGLVPRLIGTGCAKIGGSPGLQIDHAVGAASGLLFIGLSQASLSLKGGNFLVGSVVLTVPLALGGAAGVPGDGSVTLTAPLPSDPLLQGSVIVLQVGLQDAGAAHGVTLTQGLRMEIG